MATMEYHELAQGTQYDNFRFSLMSAAWGAEKKSYLFDGDLPFIGTGFNLASSFSDFEIIAQGVLQDDYSHTLVTNLWDVIDNNYSPGQDAELRNDLHQVMVDWAQSNSIDKLWFDFSNLGDMKDVLQTLGLSPESTLEWGDTDVPFSRERAAMFSVAHEAAYIDPSIDISGILQAALQDVDRFGAWYEMRYELMGTAPSTTAAKRETAMRRYVQSDYFGLYNPGTVAYAEAYDVIRGYQSHRNDILKYEHSYDPDAGVATPNAQVSGIINEQLQPAIVAIAKHFGISGHFDEALYVRRSDHALRGDATNYDTARNDDDLLIGNGSGNSILGEQGKDAILGLGGNDRLSGGAGNDRLYGGDGSDTLYGGSGNDTLYGGNHGDRLDAGSGNDRLYGDDNNDALYGGDGSDTLYGGSGNDILSGGNHNDRLDSGSGNDRLEGGTGSDILEGGTGNDRLDGGTGNDRLYGGTGNDTFFLDSDDDLIFESGGGGTDTVYLDAKGNYDIRNVEYMRFAEPISGNVALMLNEFDRFILSDKSDLMTLTVNKLQKDTIDIYTGGGHDVVKVKLSPGIDPSQVLDHKGVTARFNFADLTANDTIDLTSIGIKKIIMSDWDIVSDSGFYLMAPDAQIHLMKGDTETKTYTNNTDSWFVVKCGDDTPYGPEFLGDHLTRFNFDI